MQQPYYFLAAFFLAAFFFAAIIVSFRLTLASFAADIFLQPHPQFVERCVPHLLDSGTQLASKTMHGVTILSQRVKKKQYPY